MGAGTAIIVGAAILNGPYTSSAVPSNTAMHAGPTGEIAAVLSRAASYLTWSRCPMRSADSPSSSTIFARALAADKPASWS